MNKLRKNIAISETGFIFDPSCGDSFTVNNVGYDIILLLNKGICDEDVFTEIMNKYEVDKFTLENNYHEFLAMLNQHQLLENE